jgi:hypothetical protein
MKTEEYIYIYICQGMKTEKMLPSTAYELAMVYMGRMDAAWIYPRNFLQWTDHIQAEDAQGDLAGLEVCPRRPPARPSARPPARPSARPPARPAGHPPARPPARPPAYLLAVLCDGQHG